MSAGRVAFAHLTLLLLLSLQPKGHYCAPPMQEQEQGEGEEGGTPRVLYYNQLIPPLLAALRSPIEIEERGAEGAGAGAGWPYGGVVGDREIKVPPYLAKISRLRRYHEISPHSTLYYSGEQGDKGKEKVVQQQQQQHNTPYISSRALTNVPSFFGYLADNVKSLDEEDADADVVADADAGRGQSYHLYSNDGRLNVDLIEKAGGVVPDEEDLDRTGLISSNELLNYMGRSRDPKWKKANSANPKWLFTNLGLGK